MVIGPHHAAVMHVGGSSEVGQREHMVRLGIPRKCWSEFLCLGDYLARRRRKKKLSACRGEGSVVGPLLAARALPLRCAASTMLTNICTGY
jgi:hypothetical protein